MGHANLELTLIMAPIVIKVFSVQIMLPFEGYFMGNLGHLPCGHIPILSLPQLCFWHAQYSFLMKRGILSDM